MNTSHHHSALGVRNRVIRVPGSVGPEGRIESHRAMMIQSNVGVSNVGRLVRVTRTARAFAPLLLVGAYLGCSADAEELDASAAEAASLERESPAAEQGSEVEGNAAPELGELTQAQAAICTPGAILGCLGASLAQCNSDGTDTNVLPCAPDFTCVDGECQPVDGTLCPANTVIACSGTSLLVCNATSTNTNVVPCPAGTACVDRQCIVGTLCPADTAIGCNGPSLVVCNSSQTNTCLVDCPAGTTCVDAECI